MSLIRYSPSPLETAGHLLIYGMSVGSLQHRLNMTHEEANELARDYWRAFPRIRPWLFEVITECRKQGYVTYWSGRIWREDDPILMYKAANALIQGGAHDVLMTSVLRVQTLLHDLRLEDDVHISSLVHDEIDIDLPAELLPELKDKLAQAIEVPDIFGLPMFTDLSTGTNLGHLEKVRKTP